MGASRNQTSRGSKFSILILNTWFIFINHVLRIYLFYVNKIKFFIMYLYLYSEKILLTGSYSIKIAMILVELWIRRG